MNKFFKKTLCGVLAVTSAVASIGIFSACETKKPEVEIQLQFQNTKYTLDYTLYREVAPNTVEHFLALAENNYYDGLCFHNYTSASMVGGEYSYVEGGEDGGLVYKDYYATVKADSFKNFHQSVWEDEAQTKPTYTLYGEFSSNNFQVQNNPLKQGLGSLSMYYNEKDTEADAWVQRADGDGMSMKKYKYNAATSAFAISLDATEKNVSAKYCTFGILGEDGKAELSALLEAIGAYIADNFGENGTESDFVNRESVHVDQNDTFLEDGDYVSFKIPKQEIRINYVKVTKY